MSTQGFGRAVFLGPNGHLSVQRVDETYEPRGDQCLVNVKYSAINPADIRHSYMGLYGSVAGYEWTGAVVKIGNTSPFAIGQILFGVSLPGQYRPHYLGAHQDFLITSGSMTWALPHSLSPEVAVAMPVGVQTATDALFNIMGFSFRLAGLDGDNPHDVPLLIWGGASAVGSAAIQLAKVAGFCPIFTTASKKNHSMLMNFGATKCFDYHDANIIANIKQAVAESGKQLSVVFDAAAVGLGIFEPETSVNNETSGCTPDLARDCCSERDSISLRLCAVLPVAHDPDWKFCLGTRPEGDVAFGQPQNRLFPKRVANVMSWLVANHNQYWQPLPAVIVKGAELGIIHMERVFRGEVSMEKTIIEHPM